jgi:threonine aldolase
VARAGGAAANAGVQIHEIGQAGVFTAGRAARRRQAAQLSDLSSTTLVEIENTHNRAGGVVPQAEVLRVCAVARELGLATFLDGAAVGTPAPPAAWRCTSWLRRSISWPSPSARG